MHICIYAYTLVDEAQANLPGALREAARANREGAPDDRLNNSTSIGQREYEMVDSFHAWEKEMKENPEKLREFRERQTKDRQEMEPNFVCRQVLLCLSVVSGNSVAIAGIVVLALGGNTALGVLLLSLGVCFLVFVCCLLGICLSLSAGT